MSNGIQKADGRNVLLNRNGNTSDIISAILETIPDVTKQTAGFAASYSPDADGMQRLWIWVKKNIRYIEDPMGIQWVREPARLWKDREGDCKSFTVFIVSVLQNLGLGYKVRFASYDYPKSRYTHVYPIAILPNGQEIIMDAVWDYWNNQKPLLGKKDYKMSEIYRLSGIGSAQNIDQKIAQIEAILADVPDSVIDADGGDLTVKTAGQFDRWLSVNRLEAQASASDDPATKERLIAAARAIDTNNISGIGNIDSDLSRKIGQYLQDTAVQTQPAFARIPIILPEGVSGIGSLGDKLKGLIKKLLNWVFKKALPNAAPFFLYAFLKKKAKGKTGIKQDKQHKILDWISKLTGTTKNSLTETIRTAILKKTGKTPEAVLNSSAKATVAGTDSSIGSFAIILGVIEAVIEIIKKIAGLFNKSKKETPESDASDAAPNEEEFGRDMMDEKPQSGGSTSKGAAKTEEGGGTQTGLLIGAAVVAAAIFLK